MRRNSRCMLQKTKQALTRMYAVKMGGCVSMSGYRFVRRQHTAGRNPSACVAPSKTPTLFPRKFALHASICRVLAASRQSQIAAAHCERPPCERCDAFRCDAFVSLRAPKATRFAAFRARIRALWGGGSHGQGQRAGMHRHRKRESRRE